MFVSDKRTGRFLPEFLRVSGLTTPAGYDCNIDPLLDSQSNQRPFEGCLSAKVGHCQYMGIYRGIRINHGFLEVQISFFWHIARLPQDISK